MCKINVMFITEVLVNVGVVLHQITKTEVLIIQEWAQTSETIKNMMQLQLKP